MCAECTLRAWLCDSCAIRLMKKHVLGRPLCSVCARGFLLCTASSQRRREEEEGCEREREDDAKKIRYV